MKKSYIFIDIFLIFILCITIILSSMVTGNVSIKKETDILDVQSNKEVYFTAYGYSIDNPNIIVNPYGNSPLTGVVLFETSDYSEVNICIMNKSGKCDIDYTFGKEKYHIIPIYGLYADYNNVILIRSEGRTNTINIKTDSLPDDFGEILYNENYSFYNGNYPYASDNEGNVRWYFNENYYGNITLDSGYVFIGNDSYTEEGHSTGIYKMNLLGKIFSEYLLEDDYFGYSTYYEGKIYAISKDVVVIDSQTGDIVTKYKNDNYDLLDVCDGNILFSKDSEWFGFSEGKIVSVNHLLKDNKYSFYDDNYKYRVVHGVRYGNLRITDRYKKDISIIKYDKYEDSIIDIKMDVNRISVYNKNGNKIYLILDKLFDKRIYEIKDIKYINLNGLNGKYTIYYKIDGRVYKTDYFIEV